METTALVWILLFPLTGAAVLALGRNHLSPRLIGALGSLAVGASFAVALSALGAYRQAGAPLVQALFTWAKGSGFQVDFGLLGDPISLWWLLVVTGVGFLIHVYASEYMAEDPDVGRFFAKLNYFVFAMSLLVLADNFVGLLIGWANVGLASYLLIGFWNYKPEAAAAAKKAFLLNVIGEVGIILALVLMFMEFRSLAFADVFAGAAQADAGIVTAVGLLLLVGATAKSAQLPLFTWLPDAMQGPTPVSALMHAATMVTAGVYLMARAFPIYQASSAALAAVAWVGGLTALVGAVVATRQVDIKRVLAYSTMSQLGYMMLGAGVGAYTASLFHFFTHAFFKALLFLGAGMVAHYLHGEQDIRRMGGLGKRLPFAYWTFLIGVLAIAGAPPFAGFFSKDEILGAVLAQGHVALWLIGVLVAGLTAYYMVRLFALVFAGEPAEEHGEGHESGLAMKLPVAILALLSTVSGLIAIPGVTAVPAQFLEPAFLAYGYHVPHGGIGWPVAVVLAAAAAGALLAVRAFGPRGAGRQEVLATAGSPLRGALANAFYIDDVYQKGIGGLVVGTSYVVGNGLEPYVIDGLVNGVAGGVRRIAQGLGRLHGGYVRRYTLVLFAGVAVFMIYFLLI